uniref:helix-turn-helix domain-containing protein n=1 Tax=Paractinoplanes polyasparticus TaxID=2856853 RepID=UPI001C84E2EB|nr:helix-turn-helix domain-containing protein [Actinoplanes polyasparticus]
MGERFAMPSFHPATTEDFRARAEAVRLHDVVYNSIDTVTAVRTTGFATRKDLVRVWIVRRGSWRLGDERGTEHRVAAGRMMVCRGPMTHFTAAPGTSTQLLILPAAAVGTGRLFKVGSATLPEVRVLLAHAATIRTWASDLGLPGRRAVRNTLVELVRSVTSGRWDDKEPRFGPALAKAARDLADQWLTHPGLSPDVLARELNVSLRTLQRAFAAEGDSVSAYLRARRLAEARKALTVPTLSGYRPGISEVAARWQFADASHFSREFRRRYGMTPGQHVSQQRLPH